MRKSNRKIWVHSLSVLLIIALAVWIGSRWKVWFGNPPEPPYEVSSVPDRVLLTFGDDGELSRYVTWMCDTVVDPDARLLIVESEDTVAVKAIGEVFVSRAGKAAYYRAHLTNLVADREYSYCVQTNGSQSPWYKFRTTDPHASRFSFLYLGDVQDTIGGIFNQLLRKAVRLHPEVEFVAFGGDLTERPMDKYWAETFRGIDSICTSMPVITITGNHDYLKYIVRKCERRFSLVFPYFLQGMAERDDENHLWNFTYHNTEFTMLDSDRGVGFLWQQRQWLKHVLAQSQAAHHIALLHHPLYSVKRKNNNLEVRWMFNDLLQEAGVDLILQGHEHAYTHCTASEPPLTGHDCTCPPLYVISHCSPKNYRIHPEPRFSPVLSDSRYYQVISVDAESVVLRGYDANTDMMIDSVKVTKSKLNHNAR